MPKESPKKIAAQYATAALSGGVGKMVDKATSRGVSRMAERAANRHKARNNKRKRGRKISEKEPEKKLAGVGFWMMVTLAIIKDSSDLLLTPSFFLVPLTIILTILISFIIFFYLFYNGVNFTSKVLARLAICFIIELIPFVNALIPATTMSLFFIRTLENNEGMRKFAEKKMGLLAKI